MKKLIKKYQEGTSGIKLDVPVLDSGSTKVIFREPIQPVEMTYQYVNPNQQAKDTTYVPTEQDTPDFNKLTDEQKQKLIDAELKSLKGKSKDEIKQYQQVLANEGFYDNELFKMSKDEVINLQTKLQSRGLYDKKIDGIIGKATIAGWRSLQVDGIIGNKTKQAIKNKINPQRDFEFHGRNQDKGCAEFVTKQFNRMTGVAQESGVIGNAWTMLENIKSKGGTYIYNIYSNPRFNKNLSVSQVRQLQNELTSQLQIDYSALKIGDIVGLYNPSSSWQSQAINTGTTFNTHVGMIVGFDKDGTPLIQHNLHKPIEQKLKGTGLHTDRIDKLGSQRVAAVIRPKNSQGFAEYEWDLGESQYNIDESVDNDNLKIFRNSMAGFAPALKKLFPSIDTNEIQEMALGLLKRETGMMNKTQSQVRSLDNLLSGNVWEWGSGMLRAAINHFKDQQGVSSNLTKTKLTSFNLQERAFLGINSPEDLEDPKKAAAAVMYLLAKNNAYFKKYSYEHPELKLTTDDIWAATVKSYNIGLRVYKSLGYDDETGEYSPQEIDRLRAQNDTESKVFDYKATNLHRLLKRVPILDNIAKTKYEQNEDNLSPGYSANARLALQELISKNSSGGKLINRI